MRLPGFALAASLSLAGATMPADALACGGCFPPTVSEFQSTVVTGHRMAVAISPTQTVLWDQIQYSGSPESFAWVLPVMSGAVIELSTDAWFEALDATTSANVASPVIECAAPSSSGCNGGCKKDSVTGGVGGGSSGGAGGPPPVTVVHQGTVGPYETVTLHANVPGALPTWLGSHGYTIDPKVQPLIDDYTAEGFDFIALRLLPTQGVNQMKPVRVVTQGGSPTLPLRMVAAGTGPHVAITLFVIGEGRYEAQNFHNAEIDPSALVWDFDAQDSNYSALRNEVLALYKGRTWNTAFAMKNALLSPLPDPFESDGSGGFGGGPGGTIRAYEFAGTDTVAIATTIAEAYVQQGISNGEASSTFCLAEFSSAQNSASMVVEGCMDASCLPAEAFACGALDDVAVALVGLHPADVWLTRLEANLPHSALSSDLILGASPFQDAMENRFQTSNYTGDPCAAYGGAVASAGHRSSRQRNERATTIVVLLAVAAAFARRARRLLLLRGHQRSTAG
jgi:hypothetical protein